MLNFPFDQHSFTPNFHHKLSPFDNLIYSNIIHFSFSLFFLLLFFYLFFFLLLCMLCLGYPSHGDYPFVDIHFSGPANKFEHFLYSAFRIFALASLTHSPLLLYCIIFNFMTFSLNLFIPPLRFGVVFFFWRFVCCCSSMRKTLIYTIRLCAREIKE